MTSLITKNIKKFRRDLKLGKVLVGGWMQASNSNLAEVMSDSNYNWIALDMEHGSFSIGDLPNLFRAIELKNKLTLVRLPNKNVEVCSQVLDAGCAGVIIPNINNASEFISIRNSCYLPPDGTRSVGYSRVNLFSKKFTQYKKQKIKPIIIAMIENIASVKNLEKLLLIKGLDAILIGPYDLSASMGLTGQSEEPEYIKILSKIKNLSQKFNIPLGIHIVQPDNSELKVRISEGYQFIAYSIDSVFLYRGAECPDLK